jgi:hypothetical protein
MPFPSEVTRPAEDEAAAERALIPRLKAGDGDAYEDAVRVYSSRLLAVTRRILGSDEEARDALQDTSCPPSDRLRDLRATRGSRPGCTASR